MASSRPYMQFCIFPTKDDCQDNSLFRRKKMLRPGENAQPYPSFGNEKMTFLETNGSSIPSSGQWSLRSSRCLQPCSEHIPQFPRSTPVEKADNRLRHGFAPRNCRLLNCSPLRRKSFLQLQDPDPAQTWSLRILCNPVQMRGPSRGFR